MIDKQLTSVWPLLDHPTLKNFHFSFAFPCLYFYSTPSASSSSSVEYQFENFLATFSTIVVSYDTNQNDSSTCLHKKLQLVKITHFMYFIDTYLQESHSIMMRPKPSLVKNMQTSLVNQYIINIR